MLLRLIKAIITVTIIMTGFISLSYYYIGGQSNISQSESAITTNRVA